MYAMIMATFTINIPLFCWHQSTIHTDPMGTMLVFLYCQNSCQNIDSYDIWGIHNYYAGYTEYNFI